MPMEVKLPSLIMMCAPSKAAGGIFWPSVSSEEMCQVPWSFLRSEDMGISNFQFLKAKAKSKTLTLMTLIELIFTDLRHRNLGFLISSFENQRQKSKP